MWNRIRLPGTRRPCGSPRRTALTRWFERTGDSGLLTESIQARASPLTEVGAEAELVMASLPASATLLADEPATRAEVMARLGCSDWVHFACHALTDFASPSESRLVLHDGTLRVSELASLRVNSASLAFLSACATASGGDSLPDETIHISSAFQLAGVPKRR